MTGDRGKYQTMEDKFTDIILTQLLLMRVAYSWNCDISNTIPKIDWTSNYVLICKLAFETSGPSGPPITYIKLGTYTKYMVTNV